MVLGVAALIIVLSVMNGFQAEMRDRMLGLMAHGLVENADGAPLSSWQTLAQQLKASPDIVAVAPLVGGDAMLSANGLLRAVELNGVDYAEEQHIAQLQQHMHSGSIDAAQKHRYGIVLGALLARSLGVQLGDSVTVILPQVTVTPMGVRPRLKQFTLVGVFEVGADMDATHAYIRLEDAQRLYALGQRVQALRYLSRDVLAADDIARQLQRQLPDTLKVIPWTQQRLQLFTAIKMEKLMVMLMLSIVIAVAAFNLISVLSMMVADKRSEIAVLRMMGMRQGQVLTIFMTQGISLALVAIVIGGSLGMLLALNLTTTIQWLEQTFGFYIFDPRVFYISGLPSQLQSSDVIYVVVFSLLLSLIFSAYPAYRAARIEAVEALQYQ